MMPHSPNPMHVSEAALRMADKTEGMNAKVFQHVAVISMVVVALSSLGQVAIELLKRKETRNHDRDECSRHQRP